MKVGFACRWYRPDPRPTWSYTPWNLRAELGRLVDIVDVGPELGVMSEGLLKASHIRLDRGRLVSRWGHSRSAAFVSERDVRRRVDRSGADAVIQMMDYAVVRDRPSFLYQDLSRSLVLDRHGADFPAPAELNDLTRGQLEDGVARQQEIYRTSQTIFCMSQWLADSLIRNGVSPSQVQVVPPGINSGAFNDAHPTRTAGPRNRLIMIGKDLIRKGLTDVVDALGVVRRERQDVTLTVAGPASWPLRGAPPSGVDFVGTLSREQVAAQLRQHDLFVMPSQWEAFGIAFAEALVAGLPCIGRNDCAMPEIIAAPKFGRVVGAPGEAIKPSTLAQAIMECLDDAALFHRVDAARQTHANLYSWATSAKQMAREMDRHIKLDGDDG